MRGRPAAFPAALIRFGGRRLILVGGLTVVVAATEGAGLLLLVPLLAQTGLVPAGPGPAAFSWPARLGLPGVLAAFVLVAAGRALLVSTRDVRAARLHLGFVDDLRSRLFRAVSAARWPHLTGLRRSDLLQALTSDIARVGLGAQIFFDLAATGLVALAYVGVAAYLSVPAAGLAVGVGALLMAGSAPLLRRARHHGERLTARNRRLYATATDFLDGLRRAKADNAEAAYVASFQDAADEERAAVLDYQRSRSTISAGYAVGSAIVVSAIVAVAVGWFAIAPARLLVLVLVLSRLLPLIGGLAQRGQQLAHAMSAFAGIDATVRAAVAAAEPPPVRGVAAPELRGELRLNAVTVRFDADGPAALSGVDLTIPAGSITAIVGPSGAGKSTLADVLCGLLPPTSGRFDVDGVTIDAAARRAWRTRVGYVPQEVLLGAGTVADNLRRGAPDASDDELWAALRCAAADEFVTALPAGLGTDVGERGARLSGGERQRLGIARALLRRPDLLILDEASSALDAELEQRVRHALAAWQGPLTVVVIAHRLSAVQGADRIVVLDRGRIVETGTWAELTGTPGGRLRALAVAAGSVPSA